MVVLVCCGEELGEETNSHSWSSEEHDDGGGWDDVLSRFDRSMLTGGYGDLWWVWLLLTGLRE